MMPSINNVLSIVNKLKYGDRGTIRFFWRVFIIILISTLIAELFMHRHSYFGIDGLLFFHAWFGFLSCVAIVLFSKLLGFFLKRKANYYKKES